MGAQASKAAAAAAAGTVETTQRIVDLATDDDNNDRGTAGKERGKEKGVREGGEEVDEEEEEDGAEAEVRGEGFEGDGWEEGEVERGMLHALVELGHLEMLLHQVWCGVRACVRHKQTLQGP